MGPEFDKMNEIIWSKRVAARLSRQNFRSFQAINPVSRKCSKITIQ